VYVGDQTQIEIERKANEKGGERGDGMEWWGRVVSRPVPSTKNSLSLSKTDQKQPPPPLHWLFFFSLKLFALLFSVLPMSATCAPSSLYLQMGEESFFEFLVII
jgi:hypothetical protein